MQPRSRHVLLLPPPPAFPLKVGSWLAQHPSDPQQQWIILGHLTAYLGHCGSVSTDAKYG